MGLSTCTARRKIQSQFCCSLFKKHLHVCNGGLAGGGGDAGVGGGGGLQWGVGWGGGGDGISISNARSFSNSGPPRQSVGM